MYGLILEIAETPSLKYLKKVLDTVGDAVKKYNWMLSDYEIHSNFPDALNKGGDGVYTWLNSESLLNIANNDNPKCFWCVATAYNKQIPLNDIIKYGIPYADGYSGFWTPDITMQNSLADIEIVFWDGTYLLVFSKQKEITDKFSVKYPQSMDIVQYNILTLNECITKLANKTDKVWGDSMLSFIKEYHQEKYIQDDLYVKFIKIYG